MLFERAGKYLSDIMLASEGGPMADKPTKPRKNNRSLLVAACMLLTCAAFAQTPQPASSATAITMQQAVDLARAKNPTLLAAQQNLLSVKAQEIQAGVRANPYFTASGGNLTETDSNTNPYNFTLGVGRLFERGQKRRWRLDVARSTTTIADAQRPFTIQQRCVRAHRRA